MRIRRWSAAGSAIVLLLGAGLPIGVRAAPVCIADLPELFARQEVVVPLGCELVDCCPRCPADAPLDLRIRLEGEAVRGAVLNLRGGRRDPETLRLEPGDTRLGDVAEPRPEGAPRSASVAIRLEPEAVARWQRASETSPAGATLGTVSLSIEQWLGGVRVNERLMKWPVVSCFQPEPCDRVVQTGNTDGDESVLLLDARRQAGPAGCRDDERRRSAETEPVGNLLEADGCRSEVGIFSQGDAAAFVEKVDVWTDACGDVLTVDLEPLLEAPATVWVAVPAPLSLLWWGEADTAVVVQEDFKNAAQIYDQNKTGIAFDADLVKVSIGDWKDILAVLEDTPVLELLLQAAADEDPTVPVCALPAELEELGFYRKDRLNVYYLPLPFTGMICDDDRNVIFVGLVKKPATLAHELSHSFSLLGPGGHTRDLPGFDETNVMWVKDSTPRTHFSLGQAFRHNLDETSTLNVNQVRNGPERRCPALPTSPDPDPACPRLEIDWTRP